MTTPGERGEAAPANNAQWETILLEGHRSMRVARMVFRHLPSAPRCKVCNSPYGGFGGKVAGLAGFRPSRKNPYVCSKCCDTLPEGGATVDIAVLFADVRGSTTMGERMNAAAFAGRMSTFYRRAMAILLKHDALIDKIAGDEVMALFIPGVAGEGYRREACEAAIELRESFQGTLPVGIGVNAGPAFVGNVGVDTMVDFTALGDMVNTAARLQAAAGAGEIVFSEEAYRAISLELPGLERRELSLKGKEGGFAVRVLASERRSS